MHQEYVVVPSALTHTLTPIIKSAKIVTTVKTFKTNILRVYQYPASVE